MNLGYQSIYQKNLSFLCPHQKRKKRILKKSKIFGNFYPKSISFLVSSRKKKEIYERRRNVINWRNFNKMSYTISVSGLIPLKSSIHRRTAQRSMKVSPPLSLFLKSLRGIFSASRTVLQIFHDTKGPTTFIFWDSLRLFRIGSYELLHRSGFTTTRVFPLDSYSEQNHCVQLQRDHQALPHFQTLVFFLAQKFEFGADANSAHQNLMLHEVVRSRHSASFPLLCKLTLTILSGPVFGKSYGQ